MFESERMRMAVLASLFGLLTLMLPFFAWVFHEDYSRFFRSYAALGRAMAVCGGLVAYWLLVRELIARVLRRGGVPLRALRFVNAVIETSVPTLLMLAAVGEADPVAVLQGPPVLLYGIFIILSTLRLEF